MVAVMTVAAVSVRWLLGLFAVANGILAGIGVIRAFVSSMLRHVPAQAPLVA